MAQNPGADDPNEEPEEGGGKPQNPFAGTPFEAVFEMLGGQGGQLPDLSALGLGGAGGPGGPGGMDLSALMGQFQAMMQPHDGTVNWNLARDTARRVTSSTPDPSVTTTEDGQRRRRPAAGRPLARRGHRLPERHQHDRRLEPRGVGRADAPHVAAARRAGRPARRQGDDRGAARGDPCDGGPAAWACSARPAARSSAPRSGRPSARSRPRCSAPPTSACRSAPVGRAALHPDQRDAFADGLDVPEDDVRLYLALREAAHQRLFAHVPWLRCPPGHRGRGLRPRHAHRHEQDRGAARRRRPDQPGRAPGGHVQRAVRAAEDPRAAGCARPASRRSSRSSRAGSTTWSTRPAPTVCPAPAGCRRSSAAAVPPVVPPRTPSPRSSASSCARAGCATPPRSGATCGSRKGVEARDAVWRHPDLMPGPADLDDPLGFAEGRRRPRSRTRPRRC